MEILLKKIILLCLMLSGCVVYSRPREPYYSYECVNFCDNLGCREICAPHYYTNEGYLVYWDNYFNCWIGPHGYWAKGVFYKGYVPGYHNYYHPMPLPRIRHHHR